MANIVLATFGSLGDLHPKMAVAAELSRRGHDVSIAAMEFYRDAVTARGIGFSPLGPHLSPDDAGAAALMDRETGTEKLIREVIFGSLEESFNDLANAAADADLLITGEVVYTASSFVELSGVPWISTSLAPISFFSMYDPPVPPTAVWMKYLRPFGRRFHRAVFDKARESIEHWYEPYREFRTKLGLDADHDPIFRDKFSRLLHLAMYSKALGTPQPDWPKATLQTGFCFYDGPGDDLTPEVQRFLADGEPPVVFTLGSAAVLAAEDFFEVSAEAARLAGKRAVLLHGLFGEAPFVADGDIAVCDYAPFSRLFPRASAVVNQGGIGTVGQALLAGIPQLIVPFAHDQPDNAERCRRAGAAITLDRSSYSAKRVAERLKRLVGNRNFRANAIEASRIIRHEHGTETACDAIEDILKKIGRRVN